MAIGREIERQIGSRQGQRTDKLVQNFAEVPAGTKTRDLAADRAGFGNAETYRQAKSVVDKGHPDVVAAMDAEGAPKPQLDPQPRLTTAQLGQNPPPVQPSTLNG